MVPQRCPCPNPQNLSLCWLPHGRGDFAYMTKELILRWEIILIIPVSPMKSQGSLHGKEGGRGATDVIMEANTGVMGGHESRNAGSFSKLEKVRKWVLP